MQFKIKFLFIILCSSLILQAQEIDIQHHFTSDQTYQIQAEGIGELFIYLNFYEPGIVNYNQAPLYFVAGWYNLKKEQEQKNIIGIYYPYQSLTLYVPKDENKDYLIAVNENDYNIDTSEYFEKLHFPLDENSEKSNQATWYNDSKEISINNIDVDDRNKNHNIYLTSNDWNFFGPASSIDITEFVVPRFAKNDLFLEDFEVKIYQTYKDSLDNSFVVLYALNEYVVPSSFSSGGYFFMMIDKHQVIRKINYLETYRQGLYESWIDESFQHKTKTRYLVVDSWDDEQIIGSFFIEKGRLQVENKW